MCIRNTGDLEQSRHNGHQEHGVIYPSTPMYLTSRPLYPLIMTIGLFSSFELFAADRYFAELGFAAHPVSVVTETGKPATLSALPKGPLKSIQWRKNGDPITGATHQSLEIEAERQTFSPDEYDVLIEDAFGNFSISQKAIVVGLAPDSEQLLSSKRRLESYKLQAIFNLINIFEEAGTRIVEPMTEWNRRKTSIRSYFDSCPDHSKSELLFPVSTSNSFHQALKLELNSCFIPRSNHLGDETGALADGVYIQSNKNDWLINKEIRKVERFAKNFRLQFPESIYRPETAVDFDVLLNGKFVHTTEIEYPDAKNTRIKEVFNWESGTRIENPQSGVAARFVSGNYALEKFGYFEGRQFFPTRETEIYNNLKLEIGNDEIAIQGLVNKVWEGSYIHRSGEFQVLMNGKQVIKTPSAISPFVDIPVSLPFAPKLNGFFLNDHRSAQTSKTLKTANQDSVKSRLGNKARTD